MQAERRAILLLKGSIRLSLGVPLSIFDSKRSSVGVQGEKGVVSRRPDGFEVGLGHATRQTI